MAEPHSHFQPLDPGRIDTQSQDEMRYWSEALHCSEARLLEAVGRVGNHVTAVREHLAAHHSKSSAPDRAH